VPSDEGPSRRIGQSAYEAFGRNDASLRMTVCAWQVGLGHHLSDPVPVRNP